MPSALLTPSLLPGDRIAIVSPASIIRPQYVHGAVAALDAMGYRPWVAPHALGRHGSYSGTVAERIADMTAALTDHSIRAILCSRGGYGAVHLLEELDRLPLRADPKWLIGFSDISALHALMNRHGIASFHASMTSALCRSAGHGKATASLFSLMKGESVTYKLPPSLLNHCGTVTAPLAGGNLAVISGLAGTPFSPFRRGTVLLIEDTGEPPHSIERKIMQLRLSGVLAQLSGMIVGRFTRFSVSGDVPSVEGMISRLTASYGYPVAFGAPVGHISDNMPMVLGAPVRLEVTPEGVVIENLKK